MLLLGSKVMLWTQLSLIHSHECGVAISRAYLWWKKFRFFVFSRALGMKINRSASVCPWFQYVQSAPKGQTHNTCTNVRWTYAPVNERHFYIFTKYVFFCVCAFFSSPMTWQYVLCTQCAIDKLLSFLLFLQPLPRTVMNQTLSLSLYRDVHPKRQAVVVSGVCEMLAEPSISISQGFQRPMVAQ